MISDLVVLDIDPRHGGDASLFELEQSHGPLPRTVEAHTGGGGHHIYLRHPGGSVPDGISLAPGLEIRGDGGFVVAPPSMHPSGRRYVWDAARHPDDTPICDMPDWLVSEIQKRDGQNESSVTHFRILASDIFESSGRAAALEQLTNYLCGLGVDPVVVRELMLGWNRTHCRPPLDDTIFPLSGK
jgi:hypothetical protein